MHGRQHASCWYCCCYLPCMKGSESVEKKGGREQEQLYDRQPMAPAAAGWLLYAAAPPSSSCQLSQAAKQLYWGWKKKFNFKNFSKFRSWGNINVESTMILRKSSNVKQYSVVKTLTVGDTCKVFEQQVRKAYCRPLIFHESVLMFFNFRKYRNSLTIVTCIHYSAAQSLKFIRNFSALQVNNRKISLLWIFFIWLF